MKCQSVSKNIETRDGTRGNAALTTDSALTTENVGASESRRRNIWIFLIFHTFRRADVAISSRGRREENVWDISKYFYIFIFSIFSKVQPYRFLFVPELLLS